MYHKLKDYPQNILPRERLMKFGANALADYELLAIILRTGTKEMTVLDLAKSLLVEYRHIANLKNLTLEELKQNKGIKNAKAIEILAAIELGKRVCESKRELMDIRKPEELYEYVRFDMENLLVEEVKCAYLNNRGGVVDIIKLGMGCSDNTNADLREIVKWALKLSSYNIIIIHNHPSGDPTPSHNDRVFTNELSKYAKQMGVNLIDHLIIGKNKFFCFSQNKICLSK